MWTESWCLTALFTHCKIQGKMWEQHLRAPARWCSAQSPPGMDQHKESQPCRDASPEGQCPCEPLSPSLGEDPLGISPQLHALPAVLSFGDLLSWTTPFSPNNFWLLFDVFSCPLPFAPCACKETCSWGNNDPSMWNFSKQRSRNYSGLHLFEFSLSFH